MLLKVTKFFKNSDVKKMPSNFEAEPYKVVSKKRNNVTVRTCYSRKVTYNYVKKYREPITDYNAWEPNDVTC